MLEEFENVIHKYLHFLVTNQRDIFFYAKMMNEIQQQQHHPSSEQSYQILDELERPWY